jgi:hypothetical protein
MPTKVVVDLETGEQTEMEMTPEEIASMPPSGPAQGGPGAATQDEAVNDKKKPS